MNQNKYPYSNRLPENDTSIVVELAEELKAVPFNMTPHGAYSAARHAVARLVSPAAAGYEPSTTEPAAGAPAPDDNLRLIGELRAEVAALKASAALTENQRLLRACVALMSAAKKLRSSEDVRGLGDRLEREAKFCFGGQATELDALAAAQTWPSETMQAAKDRLAQGIALTLEGRNAPFRGEFAQQAYDDLAEGLLKQVLRAADEAGGPKAAKRKSVDAVQLRNAVREAVIGALSGTYYCGRVWGAWQTGTMSEEDFTPAGQVDTVVDEITDAALAALGQ